MSEPAKKPRAVRLYGLFANDENGNRVRLYPTLAYPKTQAIRVFQNSLLSLSMSGRNPELKPVKPSE
jgi:hypothetical protein